MPTYYSDEGFPYEGMSPLPPEASLPPNRREEMLASYQKLFNQGGGMQPLYSQLELDMGLQKGSLAQMARIESGGDPNSNRDKSTEYKGLFQLGNDVQKLYGVTDPYDPVQNSYAGAQYAQRHMNALPGKIGRAPEPWEIYMAHQMGLGGVTKLTNNPNAKLSSLGEVGDNALNQHVRGVTGNTTAGDFLAVFDDRYNRGWGEWNYKPEGGYSFDPNTFSGAWYDPNSRKLMPGMNEEESWLRQYQPAAPWTQAGGKYFRDVDAVAKVANLTPGGGKGMGDEEAWLRQYAPDNAWLQQGTGPYSRDASGAPTMSAKESWLRRWAPNNEALQPNGEFGVQLAKGGSNTGTGLIYDPSTGAYVPNTGGMGEEERWERQFAPNAPDLQPGGKYGPPGPAPAPAPAPMTEAQWLQAYGAPTAAQLNGFQSTQYQPPTSTVSFVDNSAPATQYQAPTFGTPSFGSLPGGVYGAAPLGGSTAQTAAALAAGAGMGTQQPLTVFPTGYEI